MCRHVESYRGLRLKEMSYTWAISLDHRLCLCMRGVPFAHFRKAGVSTAVMEVGLTTTTTPSLLERQDRLANSCGEVVSQETGSRKSTQGLIENSQFVLVAGNQVAARQPLSTNIIRISEADPQTQHAPNRKRGRSRPTRGETAGAVPRRPIQESDVG